MEQDFALHAGTVLDSGKFKYTIVKVLGNGTFGITYLATIPVRGSLGSLEMKVAVKEFFMKDVCSRRADGSLQEMTQGGLVYNYAIKFRREAENLSRLDHPQIVRVLDVFTANNTVYYAMEFVEGENLNEFLKEHGRMSESEAVSCIRSIAAPLEYMHEHKMLHLDLKPGNVMRRSSDGKCVLIDFGLSKYYADNGEPESSTNIGMGTPGYAPIEQAQAGKNRQVYPTLDIYALGGTFYKLLTGEAPPEASELLDGFPREKLLYPGSGISVPVADAIEKAMSPRRIDRPQSVRDFLVLLGECPSGASCFSDDSTVLDEKETGGTASRPHGSSSPSGMSSSSGSSGSRSSGMGVGNVGGSHGGGDGKVPSNRFKVWLIAACVIVGLVAGYILLRGLMFGGGHGGSVVPGDSTLVTYTPCDAAADGADVYTRISRGEKVPVKANPSKDRASSGTVSREQDNEVQTALDSKDEQIAALQQQIKEEREQRTRDSLAAVQRLKERRQQIKDSVAAAKRAEQEAAAKEEAARKAAEEKARQEAARKAAEEARSTTGTINGHEWVDLGLSVKWATCNVGASSPSNYGNYYAWGETKTKSEYTVDNSSTYGINIGDISGDSRYDAARANWGGTWRLPTEAEMEELMDKCTWTWTSQGGHNGYRVTGPNGSSIFLPAAGYRDGSSLYNANVAGYYHNSTPDMNDATIVYQLFIDNSRSVWYAGSDSRYPGQSVRPVSD